MTKIEISDSKGVVPKPVVLCILDGWGDRETGIDNAILIGSTPIWDTFKSTYPYARLQAASLDVGLPIGQMGNSEVGHMNLGAGRVVMQELSKIDASIADGSIRRKKLIKEFVAAIKSADGVCHMMGLVSPGGIHSHQNHIITLAKILENAGVRVLLHAFLDGRDTPPRSANKYLKEVISETNDLKGFSIATLCGRYYAMDRDNNWDRVEKAYLAIAKGEGEPALDAIAAIEENYSAGITDEFILPTIIGGYQGIKDGDGLFVLNFRADRIREVLKAFVEPNFSDFIRPKLIKLSACAGVSEYSTELNQFFSVLFPKTKLEKILGEIVSNAGLKQLRMAETEKYAHVTFFFNGGEDKPFPGEERILIPSPKVKTYDLKPEMSAEELTKELVKAIGNQYHDLIVVNYANGDMVGHTGDLGAAIKAAETIDRSLGELEIAILNVNGTMLVTADHGNLEKMSDDKTGYAHTAHTLSPVPVILVNPPQMITGLRNGCLADVAPTLIDLLGISLPSEMTGSSLIQKKS